MGKTILVTGGARSGKSRFAEGLARESGSPVLYIATAQAFDDEMKLRIRKHRESRPQDWSTAEAYRGLGEIIAGEGSAHGVVLVDCITIMVTNLLLELPAIQKNDFSTESLEAAEASIMAEVGLMMDGVSRTTADVVMVTNELGSGIVPDQPLSRIFRDIAGRVNQFIAQEADQVYMVVSGIPLQLK